MTHKHKLILFLLATSFVVQLSIVAYFFVYQGDSYASAINIAGKQRMLSQRIALFATGLVSNKDATQHQEFMTDMRAAVAIFKSHHQALLTGDEKLGIQTSLSEGLEKIYFNPPYRLDNQAKAFTQLAETFLHDAEAGLALTDSTELLHLTDMAMHSLLQSLDIAVWQYQRDADEELDTQVQLVYCFSVLMIMTLLIGAYEFYISFKQLRDQNKTLTVSQFVFDHSVDGIITTDGDGFILTANERIRDLIAYSSGAIIGRNFASLIAEIAAHESIIDVMKSAIAKTGEWRGELLQRTDDVKPISVGIRAVYSQEEDNSSIISYVMIITDISEQKSSEEKFRFLSMHDTLTGLFNRTALYQEFDSRIAVAKRENSALNLLMMDLDGFKQANDTFGHDAGDHVLITISERLKHTLRASDVLARFGGDEFIAITPESSSNGCPELIAQKIIQAISEPILWQANEIKIGVSIGIASYPHAGDQLDVLIKHADIEMYKVKQNGKNNFSVYCNLHHKPMTAISCLTCTHSKPGKNIEDADLLVPTYEIKSA